MTDANTRTIAFTCTQAHFPHIIEPWTSPGLARPASEVGRDRYSIRVSPDVFPELETKGRPQDELGPMASVSSLNRPMVLPNDGSNEDFYRWNNLLEQARRWRYRPDYLFHGREIMIHVRMWMHRGSEWVRPGMRGDLVAVKVIGDLEKDEGLAAHILDVKGWLT